MEEFAQDNLQLSSTAHKLQWTGDRHFLSFAVQEGSVRLPIWPMASALPAVGQNATPRGAEIEPGKMPVVGGREE